MTLEDRSDSDSELHLVCEVSATDDSLFSGDDTECLPAIYLVSGHQSCSGLPDTVSTKKLSDIKKAGRDDALVAATYSELPGKCMVVLRKSSCEGSGAGEAEGSGAVVSTKRLGTQVLVEDVESEEYFRETEPVLSTRGLARTYSSISLSGFSLLSSGSTSQRISGVGKYYLIANLRCLHRQCSVRQCRVHERRGGARDREHQLQQVGHSPLPPAHWLEIQRRSQPGWSHRSHPPALSAAEGCRSLRICSNNEKK